MLAFPTTACPLFLSHPPPVACTRPSAAWNAIPTACSALGCGTPARLMGLTRARSACPSFLPYLVPSFLFCPFLSADLNPGPLIHGRSREHCFFFLGFFLAVVCWFFRVVFLSLFMSVLPRIVNTTEPCCHLPKKTSQNTIGIFVSRTSFLAVKRSGPSAEPCPAEPCQATGSRQAFAAKACGWQMPEKQWSLQKDR